MILAFLSVPIDWVGMGSLSASVLSVSVSLSSSTPPELLSCHLSLWLCLFTGHIFSLSLSLSHSLPVSLPLISPLPLSSSLFKQVGKVKTDCLGNRRSQRTLIAMVWDPGLSAHLTVVLPLANLEGGAPELPGHLWRRATLHIGLHKASLQDFLCTHQMLFQPGRQPSFAWLPHFLRLFYLAWLFRLDLFNPPTVRYCSLQTNLIILTGNLS